MNAFLKKGIIFTIAVFTILLCGCGKSEDDVKVSVESKKEVLYKNADIEVCEVDILVNPQFASHEWKEISAIDSIIENDVVFEGTVSSISEIAINTEWLDTPCTIYKTILEVNVGSIINDNLNELKENDIIRIAVCVSSRQYDTYVASFVQDKKYLFIASNVSSLEDDSLQLKEYCDYYISSPVDYIMPCIEDEYYEIRGIMNELVCENSYSMDEVICSEEDGGMLYDHIVESSMDYNNLSKVIKIEDIIGNKLDLKLEILWDITNKKYPNEQAFYDDIDSLYIVSQEKFIEEINYLTNEK